MEERLVNEIFVFDPASADAGIHHLYIAEMQTVRYDEVGHAFWVYGNQHAGQRGLVLDQEVIDGHHDLFRAQPKLVGDILNIIDRGTIHRGLASLAQAPIIGVDVVRLEDAFQACRPAVHLRSLDDFWDKELSGFGGWVGFRHFIALEVAKLIQGAGSFLPRC